MRDLYLVSCVGEKQDRAMPAKVLYRSNWFTKAREYVERRAGVWYILSAKHGLISPDQVIAPYEQTLNRMPIAERRAAPGRSAYASRWILSCRQSLGRAADASYLPAPGIASS
ncbi:DUF6884 domain-containing protein [Burkholderia gladioli]|uniref:DUF6884 domain-containing protein n=1 Tax=Burkholderia gladioli TaxID=28095 RepID=UPI00030CF658|nr:DUF6884 domain-containing protein [Burkholderia gladioli]